jgi:hypothetical protein
MPQHALRCRTDGFPLAHTHRALVGQAGAAPGVVAERDCTNPWHPRRISCPRCGRNRKVVLASALIQGEPVYLHCLRCRHLWQPVSAIT